jgi:L-iditol 2-dehydrogenase
MLGLTKYEPGSGHVELRDRPEPGPPEGHVVISVAATGICGTDLHIEAGEYLSAPPVTMGHEVSGTVTEVGEGVDESWLGARVVCETYYSTCGVCVHCRSGRINLCPQRRSIGSHVDGGFAARLVLPVRNLHGIPDWLDEHAASLAEPLACVCNSLFDPPVIAAGDEVLVVGPGAIGLLAAQVGHASGARVHVRGTPRDAARLALAERLGFGTSVADGVATAPEPSADVVVECSGSAAGIEYALTTVRRGGRYVQIGLRGAPVSVPFDEICFRELVVSSGNASTPESWARALRLVEDRKVDLAPLISEVLPLTEWQRAFEASRGGEGVKYVLDPR